MTKKHAYISNDMQLQTLFFKLSFTKTNHFSQLPAFYLVHPWLTTPLLPLTSYLVPTRWTLANVTTDLDELFGPKTIPSTWM